MGSFKNFPKHLKTITRHKHQVFLNCVRAGIFWQGLVHDLSKYSPTEFIPGVKYFQGYRSPNEGEREDIGMSYAWMHHKGRNRHHFEYWVDIDIKTKQYVPVKMPTKYVIEMFCDRVAASKIYNPKTYTDRTALEYFLKGKGHNHMHPETAELLEKLLTMLAEEGEKKTFAYIRKIKK